MGSGRGREIPSTGQTRKSNGEPDSYDSTVGGIEWRRLRDPSCDPDPALIIAAPKRPPKMKQGGQRAILAAEQAREFPMNDSKPPLEIPLLASHSLEEESVFRPENLLSAVRKLRGLPDRPVPPICILEFDGDLTDSMAAGGELQPCEDWACFHTTLFTGELGGIPWAMLPRTIGGPYTVLVAEQLRAAGARLIVGLSSAGRVSRHLSLPSLVVATSAIRDEGTSLHYLPPARDVKCPSGVTGALRAELAATGWRVESGEVWTTDAPYRETLTQLHHWAVEGALAVEMQAASLFAFGHARGAETALVAVVSNAADHSEEVFDTGTPSDGRRIAHAIVRAGWRHLESATPRSIGSK